MGQEGRGLLWGWGLQSPDFQLISPWFCPPFLAAFLGTKGVTTTEVPPTDAQDPFGPSSHSSAQCTLPKHQPLCRGSPWSLATSSSQSLCLLHFFQ